MIKTNWYKKCFHCNNPKTCSDCKNAFRRHFFKLGKFTINPIDFHSFENTYVRELGMCMQRNQFTVTMLHLSIQLHTF